MKIRDIDKHIGQPILCSFRLGGSAMLTINRRERSTVYASYESNGKIVTGAVFARQHITMGDTYIPE
jgi:hypothetical protein